MALPDGWQALRYAVLSDDTLAVVGTDVDLEGEEQRVWAAIHAAPHAFVEPLSQVWPMAVRGDARIWTLSPTGWSESPAFPLETPWPIIDRFSDGRWLVVGARTPGEPNARILAADGSLLRRFMLGDGIENAVVDQADRIWVGWFDEGVYGNQDWRIPGHEWAPSINGAACFADDGALLILPDWPRVAGANLTDCYGLNLIGSGAWISGYDPFPLVYCIPGEAPIWWRNDITAPHAIAFDGRHGLLAGGFGVEASGLSLVSITGIGTGEPAQILARWSLPLRPRAAENEWQPVWEWPTLLTGRGDAIHLIDDGVWHTWRVSELVSSIEGG